LPDGLLLDYQVNGKSYGWVDDVVRVHLRSFFGIMKAAKLGTDQIRSYIATRQEPQTRKLPNGKERSYGSAANATINRELALLRRAFDLGKAATPPRVAAVPAMPMLAENNIRKGFFEYDAFFAILRALPEEVRPIGTFAYYTGCRKGEILALSVAPGRFGRARGPS
jgi:integrase